MKALSDPIGQSIGTSGQPLLANVYLHYVFDLWAERCRRREATGCPRVQLGVLPK
jgi:hypothetical protein